MDFLYLLEGIRTPVISVIMSFITYCGDETFFMVLALTIFWCINKRDGYYVFTVGFLGMAGNQFLKLLFRIPRPWVLDPDFTIVESARAGATGYSFPSGHTQNIVGTMSCVSLMTRQKKIRIAAIVLMILVPFSRMYLGCHTPLDVGVSFILALALAFILRPVIVKSEEKPYLLWVLLFIALVVGLLYWAFIAFYSFPADIDAENLYSGTKNAYTLLGCLMGFIAAKALDDRFIHFQVEAVWLAQILKTSLGFVLITAIRAGLKYPLQAIMPEFPAAAIRYFFMVFFAGAVWPLTFPWFAKLGEKLIVE
ncbi:MAG: phosphatase PAP2 family protein [Lachnospiraceae bacterium]|nr:phosphatase PAP2 family protein [Lachnospiraceae bacterium]